MPPVKPQFSPDELRRLIGAELQFCPQARLIDLYKLLHQAHWGPTHAPDDPALLALALRQELDSLAERRSPAWQDIGCGRGFVRVNLSALLKPPPQPLHRRSSFPDHSSGSFRGVAPSRIQSLVEAILASRFPRGIDWRDWAETWSRALPLALDLVQPGPGELETVEASLRERRMPSHSGDYRAGCRPHYRVLWHAEIHSNTILASLFQENS